MKRILTIIVVLSFINFGFAQELKFDLMRVNQKVVNQTTLVDAKSLKDINPGYPSSWINFYISVEIIATCNGVLKKIESKNEHLNTAQRDILSNADLGTNVSFNIKYNPKNSHNDMSVVKDIHFSYAILPPAEAKFPGGQEAMKTYIQNFIESKLPGVIDNDPLTTRVYFSINPEGKVSNINISEASNDIRFDQYLIQALYALPAWEAAQDSEGKKIMQEFNFVFSNQVGC